MVLAPVSEWCKHIRVVLVLQQLLFAACTRTRHSKNNQLHELHGSAFDGQRRLEWHASITDEMASGGRSAPHPHPTPQRSSGAIFGGTAHEILGVESRTKCLRHRLPRQPIQSRFARPSRR
jgi:hypothetical protein